MRAGLCENAPCDVETVLAGGQRHARLGEIFRRQRGHGLGVDIGRVGEDEIVAAPGERREKIALEQRQALTEAALVDVAARDLERVR